jgi:hypothetical protein
MAYQNAPDFRSSPRRDDRRIVELWNGCRNTQDGRKDKQDGTSFDRNRLSRTMDVMAAWRHLQFVFGIGPSIRLHVKCRADCENVYVIMGLPQRKIAAPQGLAPESRFKELIMVKAILLAVLLASAPAYAIPEYETGRGLVQDCTAAMTDVSDGLLSSVHCMGFSARHD